MLTPDFRSRLAVALDEVLEVLRGHPELSSIFAVVTTFRLILARQVAIQLEMAAKSPGSNVAALMEVEIRLDESCPGLRDQLCSYLLHFGARAPYQPVSNILLRAAKKAGARDVDLEEAVTQSLAVQRTLTSGPPAHAGVDPLERLLRWTAATLDERDLAARFAAVAEVARTGGDWPRELLALRDYVLVQRASLACPGRHVADVLTEGT